MVEPVVVRATPAYPVRARSTPTREGALPAPPEQYTWPTSSAEASVRDLLLGRGRRTSTSARRPPLPGEATVPELELGSSAAVPAPDDSSSGTKTIEGRDVPAPVGPDRGRAAAASLHEAGDHAARSRLAARRACPTRRLVCTGRGQRPRSPDSTATTRSAARKDAFRRDFTVNALFTTSRRFAIIDYVGGLEDLRRGLIRCIGDRTSAFARIPCGCMPCPSCSRPAGVHDRPAGLRRHRAPPPGHRRARARHASSRSSTRSSGRDRPRRLPRLADTGLLEHVASEIAIPLTPRFVRALEALDRYRDASRRPDALTNAVLVGTMLIPRTAAPAPARGDEGAPGRCPRRSGAAVGAPRHRSASARSWRCSGACWTSTPPCAHARRHDEARVRGCLRGDGRPRRRPRGVAHWRGFVESRGTANEAAPSAQDAEAGAPPRRRRRRRRRPFPR